MKFRLSLSIALLGVAVSIAPGPARANDAPGAIGFSAEELSSQVEIRRDPWNVPHVLGENIPAAVFGFGYAQAEDRILGIAKVMIRARGELASHFGEESIETDIAVRRFGFHEDAVAGYPSLSRDVRALYEAYSLGVNMYIAEHRNELPAWVTPLNPADVLAASRFSLLAFSFNRGGAIEKIVDEQTEGDEAGETESARATSPDDAQEIGSNMWALGPERSESGKALLMGNPHLPWRMTWYEGHLRVPGEYDIYGVAFIGGPIPTIAFNENLGWSHTVNYPDTEDIYVFEVDPDDANRILYDNASHPLTPVEFELEVKTEDGIEKREFAFWESEFGPVAYKNDERAWVIKSAALDQLSFVEQWFRMGQATNLAEFKNALDMNSIPMFNVIYADREGNIFYHWMAKLPVRPDGEDGREPVEVSDSSAVWKTIHPASDMPSLTNPEGGYVQNSNDPPWLTTLAAPIDREDFPAYMPEPRLRLRSQHGLDLINNTQKFTLEDVIALKHSSRALLGERLRDDLVAAARASDDPSKTLADAADILSAWDGTVARESRGGTLFELWWEIYSKDNETPWRMEWDPENPTTTPRGLGDPRRGLEALAEAADRCREQFGALDVAWGDAHRIRKGNLDLPANGGPSKLGCFRVIDYKEDEDGKLKAYGGDGWVFAVEFGDTPRAYSILYHGQSEDENSVHHTDQVVPFIEGRLKPVAFTEEEIAASLVERYRPGRR